MGLKGGESVLDVGSGLAQLTRAMARLAGPTGWRVGVEEALHRSLKAKRRAIAAGGENLIGLRQGDALD